MPKKVLITYATRSGSTGEIANEIAKILNENNCEVDYKNVKNIGKIDFYDYIIIGSLFIAGSWAPEATAFIKKNQNILLTKKSACFTTCLQINSKSEKQRQVPIDHMESIKKMINPVATEIFTGKIDYSKLGFIQRFIIKNIIKAPECDERDWDKIRNWTKNLIIEFNK